MNSALPRKAFSSARSRAARSGLPFDLSFASLEAMLARQGNRCAVSGIEFNDDPFQNAFVKHPFAPSLDRIDCSQGYVHPNVRLVCVAVNFGLGQWGDEVFRTIARATLAKEAPPATLPPNLLSERIRAAQAVLPMLPPFEQAKQRRRIAAVKRACHPWFGGTQEGCGTGAGHAPPAGVRGR
jgi:hypothetical protein